MAWLRSVPLVSMEETALAVYGTLAPGEENHWVLARIEGDWVSGTVRGWRFEIGWGPAEGYPGFVPDVDGQTVPVQVLVSEKLDSHWHEIDEFEGPGYERQTIEVTLASGDVRAAHIYVTLADN